MNGKELEPTCDFVWVENGTKEGSWKLLIKVRFGDEIRWYHDNCVQKYIVDRSGCITFA